MKKQFKILAVTLAGVAVIGLAGYLVLNKIRDKFDKTSYVASVGKQKITEDQYKYFLMSTKNTVEENSGVQTDADRKALWEGNLGDQKAEEYAKQQALDSSTTFVILLGKAKAANYKLEQDEIKDSNTQIDEYIKTLGTGEDAVKAFQTQFGLTPDKFKAINLDMSLVQKYYSEEMKKVTVTDEEIKKLYDENVQAFQQVTVKHVLFMTIDQSTRQPLAQDKLDEAKKKAEDILAKVKSGVNIGELAKQYSEDPGSKDSGGEYTFGKGEMVKEFEDWAFNAKVGDAGLVKTEYGYHVIRLEKIVGFDDVKENLKPEAINKKFYDKLEEWKKSPENTLQKNEKVLSNIKVLN
jgi:foldase protein PrsA